MSALHYALFEVHNLLFTKWKKKEMKNAICEVHFYGESNIFNSLNVIC